jgi:glycerophosphoryl diester phosphodiesterase
MSPGNPLLNGAPSVRGSRGFEAMAINPAGTHLYAVLEGGTEADPDPLRRMVLEFSLSARAFTGRTWSYRTEHAGHLIADAAALDADRLAIIERDDGDGLKALFRRVYVVDLRRVNRGGVLEKHEVVDLAAIPDPNRISWPPIHEGDVGLGNPFRVTCESIEAVLPLADDRLLLGCDNNLPSSGRNPGRADDTEFIVVRVPGLRAQGRD